MDKPNRNRFKWPWTWWVTYLDITLTSNDRTTSVDMVGNIRLTHRRSATEFLVPAGVELYMWSCCALSTFSLFSSLISLQYFLKRKVNYSLKDMNAPFYGRPGIGLS